MKIITASDFHINCLYSNFRRMYEGDFLRAVKNADHCVLNGDIFEFGNVIGDPNSYINSSIKWVEECLNNNKHCKFHYVIGNHDDTLEWLDALKCIKEKYPEQFFFDKDKVSIGDALFTHGDLPRKDAKGNIETERKIDSAAERSITRVIYNSVKHTLNLAINQKNPDKQARRFDAIIDTFSSADVKNIFVGHFHDEKEWMPYQKKGVMCYRSGCSVPLCPNIMLEITQDENGNTKDVQQIKLKGVQAQVENLLIRAHQLIPYRRAYNDV